MKRGLLYGASTYGIWGLLPLYWRLLDGAGAIEVQAHRFVWTFPADNNIYEVNDAGTRDFDRLDIC
jgi:EamA domain-containing membrane protein RarD